jgi:hypothetical protein
MISRPPSEDPAAEHGALDAGQALRVRAPLQPGGAHRVRLLIETEQQAGP